MGDERSHAELRHEVLIGWEASQRGEVVNGPTAMNQILEDLRSRYGFDRSVSCLLYPDR